MAQAARAYEYRRDLRTQRAPQTQTRPDIRVIPGKRASNPQLQSLSAFVIRAWKTALAVVAALAVPCAVAVMLSAATVDMEQANSTMASQLSAAQATGNELDIQRSILASSDRIKSQAKALGMVPASTATYITVERSINVSRFSDGTLSIAGTLDNIEASAASTK